MPRLSPTRRELVDFLVMAQLIITAVGPDRPGIVGELTGHLHSAGGNILDSRMVNLRGEFAMMILLEVSNDDAAGKLARELPSQGERMGLKLSVTPQQAAAPRASRPAPSRSSSRSGRSNAAAAPSFRAP